MADRHSQAPPGVAEPDCGDWDLGSIPGQRPAAQLRQHTPHHPSQRRRPPGGTRRWLPSCPPASWRQGPLLPQGAAPPNQAAPGHHLIGPATLPEPCLAPEAEPGPKAALLLPHAGTSWVADCLNIRHRLLLLQVQLGSAAIAGPPCFGKKKKKRAFPLAVL